MTKLGARNTAVGVAIPQMFPGASVDLELVKTVCRRAEVLGFEGVWAMDQVLGRTPSLEPVSLLALLAGMTDRVRLGISVLVLPFRNPVLLAKALATVDVLSGGRLTVGVGLGAGEQDAVFGVSREHRVRRFLEQLRVMEALWREQLVRSDGEFFQFADVAMEPKPVQQPRPPLWFGGKAEAALQRAVRFGDGWMGAGSSSTAEFRRSVARVRSFLEQTDRDPATFAISKRVYVAIDENRARAQRRLTEWFDWIYSSPSMGTEVAIWGPIESCIEHIDEIIDAGAQHLILNPMFDYLEHLEALSPYGRVPVE